jgi:hypothetical protein
MRVRARSKSTTACRLIPRRKITCRTFSVRSTVTAPSRNRARVAAALIALACIPAPFARAADVAPPIATILAAYARATHSVDVATIETTGTIAGEGLTGEFHTWRDDTHERDDEGLGPRMETTLRVGDRTWVRNSNGNVHELTGFLKRRALTSEFVDSGAFLKAPERVRFVGFGTIGPRSMWKIEVNAAGGEPETIWVDTQNGLPLRTEYLDGDGPTTIDLSDWRDVGGMTMAFRSVTSDGEHAFDAVQQTTSVKLGQPIDPALFAPLEGSKLITDGVQTVPLLDDGTRIACSVTIAGKAYTFLIDSGSGNVLLDSRLAHSAGLIEEGALEVRGATRTGGMHVSKLKRLSIGTAALEDLVISTIDLGGASNQMRLDGILGYPFFATSMVQLDFAHKLMRFGPPGSFAAPGDRIELDTDREIPEAVFRINDAIDAPFIVDTGNSADVLLYSPFVSAHPNLAPSTGTPGGAFIGVGGTDRSYGTRLASFRLGSTTLTAQPGDVIMAKSGAFADRVDAGNVGLGVLRKFTVTFDLANHALYLDRSAPAAPPAPKV